MTQTFELGQLKTKFYKVIETDNYINSLFFYHDKGVSLISNKEQES